VSSLPVAAYEPLNPTYACVGAFVDECRRAGLRHVVVCPGSRSTPLAFVLAATPAIRLWMHLDERSAAFFALGLARRLAEPVALLCTSGTAAANFLPALVEARLAHVPLLVLTADRPPELRDCGAPQAIDQNRLYGTHVKWYMETALPEASNEALRYMRTIACRALAQALAVPAGPVHLNIPLREPLTPAPIADQPLPAEAQRDLQAWRGRPDGRPYIAVHLGTHPGSPAREALQELGAQIHNCVRGLIIVGPRTADPAVEQAILQLARTTGYPLLADPLSQLRGSESAEVPVIASYDAFLRTDCFGACSLPQIVLRFGAMPTSRSLWLYLKRSHCQQVVVDPATGWEEPTQLAAQMFYAEPGSFCRELSDCCTALAGSRDGEGWQERQAWSATWCLAERTTRAALSSALGDLPGLSEGRVFAELAALLPAGSLLYVGNSMPVRDMDTFFWPEVRPLCCLGNRGANGIDGVVSSALGASAASGPGEPVVLVIGDLSFFHDLNGLLAARLYALNLVVVLINNDGGGIFSFLPQAAYPEYFEHLFGTPTGLDFRPAVEMYGGRFLRISDWGAFRSALRTGLAEGGLHVIEVSSERAHNVVQHRQLWQSVQRALQEAGLPGEGSA
jgi:2-succinyl-5-enolpyruvyl-6-hydroxy-3-cyclohexene-1-carboxylate synthase